MINKNFLNSLISTIFIFGHLYNFSNKGYIIFLALFFALSYKINKNVILVLWHIFLTILPFQRGRYFLSFVVEKEFWGGWYPINIEYYFKFTDFIIICLIALFIRLRIKSPSLEIFKLYAPKELLFLFIFLILAGISTFSATYGAFAFYQFLIYFLIVGLLFINGFIQKYKAEQNFVLSIFSIHTFIMISLLFLQFNKGTQLGIELEQVNDANPMGSFQLEAEYTYRPGGYFFDPNAAACWIIMMIPFFVYRIVDNHSKEKDNTISIFLLLIVLAGLIITGSRFIWIITLLLGIFYIHQKFYRELGKSLIIKYKKIFILLLIVFLSLTPVLLFRLSNFNQTFRSGGGIDYRLAHYKLALEYIKNNPFGIGLGMFKYEILGNFPPASFSNDPTSPHNILIELAVGTGFTGTILMCLFVYSNFKRQYQLWLSTNNHFYLAVLLSCICYITASQAYPYLLRSPLAEFFWITVGFSLVQRPKGLKYV